MRSRPAILLALAALVVGVPAALGGSSHAAANSQTFTDSVGEDASAPDITSIAVSNDDAGLITFQVNISNRPALTPDMLLVLYLDTDQNPNTGYTPALGADYVIVLAPGEVDLLKWNGTDFELAPSQTSLNFAYTTTGATIRVSAGDLGKTKALAFGVRADSGWTFDASGNAVDTDVHSDLAPDPNHGFFSYQVLTKLVLSVTAFTTSPKPAKAGRTFSVSLAATENDTNGPVRSGTVACPATLAGKRAVAVTHAVANGIATCIWRIPKTAKGRLMRGTITLTLQGVHVTRPFSARFS
jgi:hypothetical protein